MKQKQLLKHISKPGRYLGHEYNITVKDWDLNSVRFALIFPDMYEIGMSHQGLQILYHILNNRKNILAERCYAPDTDVENLLRENNRPLTTLESGKQLKEFDVVGITLPYELCYTNILTILELSGLDFYADKRKETDPIILGGGSCSMNPEPVADFFDAIVLGDGEETIVEIADTIAALKYQGRSKNQILDELCQIDSIYVPAKYKVGYHADGTVKEICNTPDAPPEIRRRVLADLDQIDHLLHPIVPNAKIVHDRLGVEVARGCTRGCRFCQAGIIYRPARERTPEQVCKMATEGIENSGFDELALLSLSTGDYSCLEQVLPELMNNLANDYVSIAMPSMRVGTLTEEVMDQIKRVRKTGFTLAPEAGSERLRRVINKGITEEDLLTTCESAFSLGWKNIKLYFMIGLPTETWDDIEAISQLATKTRAQGIKGGHGKRQINVSVGTFVPKPHTPFQWHKQLTIDESRDKIFSIKRSLTRGCNIRYHSPQQSYLEGVFSRGDRKLAQLIEAAWKNGCRLDAWSDHFHLESWQQAAKTINLNLDFYLRERQLNEVLPWSHLSSGIDEQFFKDELQKGIEEGYTPDCRYHGCQKCGLCDFKTIRPVVHGKKKKTATPSLPTAAEKTQKNEHHKYIVHYAKYGDIAFLGHLEILQLIFRGLKRAHIHTNFSQGFNPSPKISFGPALPVGTESYAEFLIMDLVQQIHDIPLTIKKLNEKLPKGIEISHIEPHAGKIPQNIICSYNLVFPENSSEDMQLAQNIDTQLRTFIESEEFIIERTRKNKVKKLDIRPIIPELERDPAASLPTIKLKLIQKAGEASVKPQEAIQHILNMSMDKSLDLQITKNHWEPLS